jgi:beta-galactosidase GanA
VDKLNKDWGLNYWGQRLNDWTEIPPQEGQRYQQWMTTDFLAWQSGIVNEYKRCDQFVTHDLAGPPLSDVNEYGVARSLDIVAVNPYHGTQDRFDGLDSTMRGDYTRSLKKTNYLVTETNAQTIGWDSKEQFPPYDGQLRLDVYIHLSSGANMVGSSKQLGAILPLLTRMLSSSVPAFRRNAWKYQARTYRHFGWDNGTVLANLLAVATALGLPARVMCGFVDDKVNRLLDLDPQREVAFSLVVLGRASALPPRCPDEVQPLVWKHGARSIIRLGKSVKTGA